MVFGNTNKMYGNILALQLKKTCTSFVFDDLRWEVIVCFVDIGGIVDHHCLNLLFIMAYYCCLCTKLLGIINWYFALNEILLKCNRNPKILTLWISLPIKIYFALSISSGKIYLRQSKAFPEIAKSKRSVCSFTRSLVHWTEFMLREIF